MLDALAALGREPTIAALTELWDPEELKGVAREIANERKRAALTRYLERLPRMRPMGVRARSSR